ncbi:MAG: PQQ-like beta-propeller repeat protein [Clostridium sp.]|nr:PQQ-like beta-propeller repeat protein [Clostridium sp.]
MKYNQKIGKVIWRNKRKFQGPQLGCKIYQQDGRAFWVKNDTELICMNAEDGEEIYSVKTNPWLYTDLFFVEDSLLFGTAGRDGYINCIDAASGVEKWSVFLKNGCAHYDIYRATVLVGDFDKRIKQIEIKSGDVLSDHPVDGEVVGDIKVYGGCVYTVIWENADKPVRLIKVKIGRRRG